MEADFAIQDPGDGGTIKVLKNFCHVALVTLSADALKTRALADPARAGLRLTLEFKTDGGDCIVTADNGVDQAGNAAMTFADAGDIITFESIQTGDNFRWRATSYDGVAGIDIGPTSANTHGDDIEEKFGDANDATMDWDGSNMKLLPKTDDTGALYVGNGTLDWDLKWWSDAAFVDFNHGTKIVEFDAIDLKLGDNDSINFGDKAGNGDFTLKFDTSNLQFLPDVDDTGAVHIGNGTLNCDFKWFSTTSGDYVEFNAGDDIVNFVDIDIALDDDAEFSVGAGKDLYFTSDGTDGYINNDDSGRVVIGNTSAAVHLGVSNGGTFVKSRLVQHQPDRGAATTSASLSDAQILSGILIGATSAAANYTLRTGTEIEDALEVIVGPIATNDSFELVIVNTGGTTGWDITVLTAAGLTIIGNPVIGALADVATEQESQGTFRFIRTAENTFDVIRVA
jgi:hypothetical protein